MYQTHNSCDIESTIEHSCLACYSFGYKIMSRGVEILWYTIAYAKITSGLKY